MGDEVMIFVCVWFAMAAGFFWSRARHLGRQLDAMNRNNAYWANRAAVAEREVRRYKFFFGELKPGDDPRKIPSPLKSA